MPRTKTFIAGGTLFPADLNAIQDHLHDEITTAVGAINTSWQDIMQWGLAGYIDVPANGFVICPMFVAVKPGTSKTALSALHRINSGTNVECSLARRTWAGSNTTIASFVVTTTSAETDFPDVALNDRDSLVLTVTNYSNSPQNMTFGTRIAVSV